MYSYKVVRYIFFYKVGYYKKNCFNRERLQKYFSVILSSFYFVTYFYTFLLYLLCNAHNKVSLCFFLETHRNRLPSVSQFL